MQAIKDLLNGWWRRGLRVALEGPEIVIHSGEKAPPAAVSDLVTTLRPEITALLQHRPIDLSWRDEVAAWSPERREEWEERAGIREFDGGFPRELAELLAYRDLLAREGKRPRSDGS